MVRKRVFTADLHTHLLEKKTKPEKYWKIVKQRKIDVVAITEHANCNPKKAFELLEKTRPEGKILIPGIELNSSIGHVLVYGKDKSIFDVPEFLEKNVSIEKIMQISQEKQFLLSISHPWGFSNDSAAFLMGKKKLEKIVQENKIGIEAFNGMMGQLSYFVYGSRWVRTPFNFFEKLENSRIAKKIRLSKIGKKAKEKIDKKGKEILERTGKAFELGSKAAFITAGSDAHSAERIGAGIIKMRMEEKIDNEKFLEALKEKKGIEWIGPLIKETNKGIEIVKLPRKKVEAFQAIKYAIVKKAKVKQRLLGKK